MLALFSEPLIVLESLDEYIDDDNGGDFDIEFLNNIERSGMSPHLLKLKVNTVFILMVNLDIDLSHYNYTKYIVQRIGKKIIVARKLSGSEHDLITVPKIPVMINEKDLGFSFTRLQFQSC